MQTIMSLNVVLTNDNILTIRKHNDVIFTKHAQMCHYDIDEKTLAIQYDNVVTTLTKKCVFDGICCGINIDDDKIHVFIKDKIIDCEIDKRLWLKTININTWNTTIAVLLPQTYKRQLCYAKHDIYYYMYEIELDWHMCIINKSVVTTYVVCDSITEYIGWRPNYKIMSVTNDTISIQYVTHNNKQHIFATKYI